MKRGISPLIASVLLIAFTVTLFVIISTWVQRSVVDPSLEDSGEKVSKALSSYDIQAKVKSAEVVGIGVVKVSIENEGDKDIDSFKVKVIGDKGSQIISLERNLGVLDILNENINFDKNLVGSVEKIEVYPVVGEEVYTAGSLDKKEIKQTIASQITGTSCLDIFNKDPNLGSGIYTINPSGSDIVVYCDMAADGGGWTLAAVCRPEDNPNYPNFKSNVPTSDCWNTGNVGNVIDPASSLSVKLSDSIIKSILNNGDKITRANWQQQYRYNSNNPTNHWIYNKITDPNQWGSSGGGAPNKEFYVKYNYADSWGSPLLTAGTGCSSASNGWSNQNYNGHGESCGSLGAWDAGCEAAPSSSHCCACQTYDERANVILWIR